MTQKIVNVSEIESIPRYDPHIDGLMHQHEFGEYIEYDYLKEVILHRAPSVSCEAVGELRCDATTGHTYGVFWYQGKPPAIGDKVYTTPQPDRVALLEAKIDKLMLEYCPNEMTKEQLDNWAKHQAIAKIEE